MAETKHLKAIKYHKSSYKQDPGSEALSLNHYNGNIKEENGIKGFIYTDWHKLPWEQYAFKGQAV